MIDSDTPFFRAWRHRLGPHRRTLPAPRTVLPATLPEIERFGEALLPPGLLSQADEGLNSRERVFTLKRTFWCFLQQVLSPATSCRDIVSSVVALFTVLKLPKPSGDTGAYCQARNRLPLDVVARALAASAQAG